MSDLEDCARDLYQLTLLSDEINVRDRIDHCIHDYLAKAKWHSSVGAGKADLATVFEAISSATHANDLTMYVLHSLKGQLAKHLPSRSRFDDPAHCSSSL